MADQSSSIIIPERTSSLMASQKRVGTATLPTETPEAQLIIEVAKGDSSLMSKLEFTIEGIFERNPSRSNSSAVLLKDATKASLTQLLIEEAIMDSEHDFLIGVGENGEHVKLSSDLIAHTLMSGNSYKEKEHSARERLKKRRGRWRYTQGLQDPGRSMTWTCSMYRERISQ